MIIHNTIKSKKFSADKFLESLVDLPKLTSSLRAQYGPALRPLGLKTMFYIIGNKYTRIYFIMQTTGGYICYNGANQTQKCTQCRKSALSQRQANVMRTTSRNCLCLNAPTEFPKLCDIHKLRKCFLADSVVGWGTMLQAGGLRVQFPMRSLDFSIELILPARTMALGLTQPLTEMSIRN
jgi:hypothetical protein